MYSISAQCWTQNNLVLAVGEACNGVRCPLWDPPRLFPLAVALQNLMFVVTAIER